MSKQPSPRRARSRLLAPLVATVLLLAMAALIWHFAASTVGVRREAPRIATITPLPPPPPPPKVKPPEPKKMDEPKPVDDKPAVPDKPVDAPKPSSDVAKQVSIDSQAQAGTDAFNIGAGAGDGMVGGPGGNGTGTGSYDQYLGYAIQQAIQRDERVNHRVFEIHVDIWMSADGHLTRAQRVDSTGDATTDQALTQALQSMPTVDARPGVNQHFPIRVAIRGRRPG